jgi:hypothetical protein
MGRRIGGLAPALLAILLAACDGDGGFTAGAPGGGNLSNPVPIINLLSPASELSGDDGFTLTVLGANFVGGSIVSWNGIALVSTFNDSSHLTALVPANLLAVAGTATIAVSNPPPGGGNSGAQTFNINGPAPASTLLSSNSTNARITEQQTLCYSTYSALLTGINRCTTTTFTVDPGQVTLQPGQ